MGTTLRFIAVVVVVSVSWGVEATGQHVVLGPGLDGPTGTPNYGSAGVPAMPDPTIAVGLNDLTVVVHWHAWIWERDPWLLEPVQAWMLHELSNISCPTNYDDFWEPWCTYDHYLPGGPWRGQQDIFAREPGLTWLRQAVQVFEDRCLLQGRRPTATEVVDIVRAALRVVVRAYNLLPQKSFEETCPFERLEAALREVREHGGDDSLLRRLHAQRRDRDTILTEVRDALQLSLDLPALRKQLVGLSKQALEYALKACHRILVIERDSRIRWPLAYLRAVAWHEERRVQAEESRREQIDKERRLREEEEKRRREQEQRRLEDRRRHPDQHVIRQLRLWLQARASGFVLELPLARLWQTLRALRLQGLDLYRTRIRSAHDQVPQLLAQINPLHAAKAPALQREFHELALGALQDDAIEPPSAPARKPAHPQRREAHTATQPSSATASPESLAPARWRRILPSFHTQLPSPDSFSQEGACQTHGNMASSARHVTGPAGTSACRMMPGHMSLPNTPIPGHARCRRRIHQQGGGVKGDIARVPAGSTREGVLTPARRLAPMAWRSTPVEIPE
ncbi:MAG: hypothetical protein AB1486_11585 [Planctomycetota bacterium]